MRVVRGMILYACSQHFAREYQTTAVKTFYIYELSQNTFFIYDDIISKMFVSHYTIGSLSSLKTLKTTSCASRLGYCTKLHYINIRNSRRQVPIEIETCSLAGKHIIPSFLCRL